MKHWLPRMWSTPRRDGCPRYGSGKQGSSSVMVLIPSLLRYRCRSSWPERNTTPAYRRRQHAQNKSRVVRGLTFLSWRCSIQWRVAASWGWHHRHGDGSRFTCNRSRWNRAGPLYRAAAGSWLFKRRMGARADSQRASERCLRRTGTGRLLSGSRQEFGDLGPTLTPGCTFESLLGGEEKRKVKNWSHPV